MLEIDTQARAQERLSEITALWSAGRQREARHLLEALAQSWPVASVLNGLGVARTAAGECEAAARCFEQALAADPQCPNALFNLLDLCIETGRLDKARRLLSAHGSLIADSEEKQGYVRRLGPLTADGEGDSIGSGSVPAGQRPRIGVLTCLWGRHALSDQVLHRYAVVREGVAEHVDLELFAVGSEGDASEALAVRNGWHYVEHPNRPLGAKWNAGLRAMRPYNLDAVLIVGSDDWVSENVFLHYGTLLRAGFVMIGLLDLHVLDLHTLRLLYWPGYPPESERAGETLGLARCLHRGLLDRLDWALWDDTREYVLDRNMTQRLVPHLRSGDRMAVLHGRALGFAALDVKSGENMWSFDEMAASAPGSEYRGALSYLTAHFPISEVHSLLELSTEADAFARLTATLGSRIASAA